MNDSTNIPKLYAHQEETVDFIKTIDSIFITSSPGTGKTSAVLTAFERQRQINARMLVLAPLSILQPSWGNDIETFTPSLEYSVAYAKNRAQAFEAQKSITITNHDAAKWLTKPENTEHLQAFAEQKSWLIIDESTAFKNPNAQRSNAIDKLKPHFNKIILMTGTPHTNTIMDIWNQIHILDNGQRLGGYYSFRSQACVPNQIRPGITQWKDKPGIEEDVADLIKDINIRHKFEDCVSIPPNKVSTIYTRLPKSLMKQYQDLKTECLLELNSGTVTAVHAGVLSQKLLQLTSGSVYDSDKQGHILDKARYELITELVKEREHSVVFFNWAHQKIELVKNLLKENISYAIIDGKTSPKDRANAVTQFQTGNLQVILAHPQAAGHGLTLTRGTSTIWASPTFNAEHYTQANSRIYRTGQTKATETIRICAEGTIEEHVFQRLGQKLEGMNNLLDLLKKL